ncbi:MAG TPA: shikimate kinase [Lachnospiraceae bacterium]|nr:shikimate kinase [Lachnospiraceae bacterium]
MNHIILIGFMGAGKTSLGRRLARARHLTFTDTDDRIVAKMGMPVTAIFDRYGEEYFRGLETKVLQELLGEKKRCVISVGGGLPMRGENQPYLKKLGRVIYLRAKVETLMGRLGRDNSRPMLRGGDLRTRIEELMAKRQDTYEKVADLIIDTDGKSFERLILEISEKIS